MHRITRYTVPAALCLTLLTASPGLAAASAKPKAAAVFAAAPAGKAIPGTEALLAQVQSLGGVGGLLKPVTDLLAAVLKSPDGKIPEADLAAFKEKIAAAIADLKKSLPATPALPAPVPPVDAPNLPVDPPKLPVEAPKLPVEAPALPVEAPKLPVDAPKLPVDAPKVPVAAPALPADAPKLPAAAPALPADAPKLPVAAPALPVAAHKAARPVIGPLDLAAGAVDKLKASVDGLTKAAGPCGCSTDAKAKATDVVTDLVAALVALLTGLGLPGLPPLPVPAPPLPAPLPVQ
ncbi:hypothetical protein [Streptomyces sp. NPDC003952]